ncbi:MAG: hypothetical protein U0X39_12595 [Bacteroidales bacterium]
MKYFSAFLLIMMLVTMPSCKWLKKKGIIGRKAAREAALIAKQDSFRIADSIAKVEELMRAAEQRKADSLFLIEQKRLEEERSGKFNIVVGSFITPEYATAYEEKFKAMGYQAKLVKLEGTEFQMVVAESYQKFSEAVGRLSRFRDTVEIDSWLYVRK